MEENKVFNNDDFFNNEFDDIWEDENEEDFSNEDIPTLVQNGNEDELWERKLQEEKQAESEEDSLDRNEFLNEMQEKGVTKNETFVKKETQKEKSAIEMFENFMNGFDDEDEEFEEDFLTEEDDEEENEEDVKVLSAQELEQLKEEERIINEKFSEPEEISNALKEDLKGYESWKREKLTIKQEVNVDNRVQSILNNKSLNMEEKDNLLANAYESKLSVGDKQAVQQFHENLQNERIFNYNASEDLIDDDDEDDEFKDFKKAEKEFKQQTENQQTNKFKPKMLQNINKEQPQNNNGKQKAPRFRISGFSKKYLIFLISLIVVIVACLLLIFTR